MNLRPTARGSQETGLTQPRAHLSVNTCTISSCSLLTIDTLEHKRILELSIKGSRSAVQSGESGVHIVHTRELPTDRWPCVCSKTWVGGWIGAQEEVLLHLEAEL